jgi:hypothetical protein
MPNILAVDFDGTVVEHKYPDIGKNVPHSIDYLKHFVIQGVRLILWTMRCDSQKEGPVLSQAVEWFKNNGIDLWGINENPEQKSWTLSPKAYAPVYIDDAAIGCPLMMPPTSNFQRPMVNWKVAGPLICSRFYIPIPTWQGNI